MKMWGIVIPEVHPDNYSKKPAYFRHYFINFILKYKIKYGLLKVSKLTTTDHLRNRIQKFIYN